MAMKNKDVSDLGVNVLMSMGLPGEVTVSEVLIGFGHLAEWYCKRINMVVRAIRGDGQCSPTMM